MLKMSFLCTTFLLIPDVGLLPFPFPICLPCRTSCKFMDFAFAGPLVRFVCLSARHPVSTASKILDFSSASYGTVCLPSLLSKICELFFPGILCDPAHESLSSGLLRFQTQTVNYTLNNNSKQLATSR